MAFITGSVTDANPGPALYALMAPALTTAGYTLVDTVVISTRTHKVWKSPAAGNAQNLDWYLDIAYTTAGAGTVSLVAFEHYDPATDLGYRGPYAASSAVIDAATGSRYGATGAALETNWTPNASTTSIQAAITTAAFGYWISVTPERVILLCSPSPTLVMYAGFYAPDTAYAAKAGGLLYPLFTGRAGGISTASPAQAALTRIPPATTISNWQNTVDASQTVTGFPQLPSGSTVNYPFTASAVSVMSTNTGNHGRWGWLRDVYFVNTNGVVRGDVCTIGGASHVLSTTGTGSYAFKAV